MGFLDTYSAPLTEKTAAHLLRRATFGPTRAEILNLSGKSASEAVDILIDNASFRASPPPPVELDDNRSDAGQPFLQKPFDLNRATSYLRYIQYWWIGLMTEQNGFPSVLEKLTAFWQNHFVVTSADVEDYRYINRYLSFLRTNALGNFRDITIGMTKDPGMLRFQNGNENTKTSPNENYARELQELFTVGQKNFAGSYNYTEDDVKAAARVLTGWQATNYFVPASTAFGSIFNPERHDTDDKAFSAHYNNTVISGKSGNSAGDEELSSLVNMLLSHPEAPKFICRKLYRWYVNPNVNQDIENQVIIPLAEFFASPINNFEIKPVLRKLLTSNIFFDQANIGAIVKSPSEMMIGMIRFFNQPVPDITTEFGPFRLMMDFIAGSMNTMQLSFLNQPSVFGSLPYYQTGYSRNWINGTSLGYRGSRSDAMVYPFVRIKPDYLLQIDVLGRLSAIQPNFGNVTAAPAITCEKVLAEFSSNLYAVELTQVQKDFLIDKIMMMNSSPRTTWTREWDAYRAAPSDVSKQNTILWRCRAMLKYMLRMAEYQLF
ncbi:DUF1800 domain-containing protein [Dyadobacter psychrophilus]|uniref:Uncharacterized conserved protein, DUF1800 family n=1 Tax=Dyadobacter psychrophilus TaxID=651661 RepID=A0A1T5HDT8_9BACT|nr:DUF1800 family protein [Dyadobacter psychrophilus]SKC18865.1 Uncharacterized conserved protein, DUF1800 family [Dyadobacter psychrophilus]